MTTKRLTVVEYREGSGASGDLWAVHRTGCADVARRAMKHAPRTWQVDTVKEAVASILDEEMVEMGYDESHIHVYPCVEGK